jgi:hypothetical protein
VAHGAEHYRGEPRAIEVGVPAPGLVDDHERVRPHVALGVPFGVLRAVVERHHLGQQLLDHTERAREREADRGPFGNEQELLELAPEALGRQVVERDGAADGRRFVVERRLETRGELQRA